MWRSLVSRLNGVQEAAGSNPVTRTTKNPRILNEYEDFSVLLSVFLAKSCVLGYFKIELTLYLTLYKLETLLMKLSILAALACFISSVT